MNHPPAGPRGRPEDADPRPAAGRRRFLQLAAAAILAGCSKLNDSPRVQSVLDWFDRLNHKAGIMTASPHRLAPTFPRSAVRPEQMRPNGSVTNPQARFLQTPPGEWRLSLSEVRLEDGNVKARYGRKEFTMEELRGMPALEQTVRHVCVEGWSAICHWKGVALADLLSRIPRRPESRFVYFLCDDVMPLGVSGVRYSVTFDISSALHPQNVLAYEYNGEPLSFEHGAPLRLAAPTHVGWKSAKYIRHIILLNEDLGGYWENQGYPRYYGF
ncbi:MAG: molybdopterin-dependent oxidoreductase [bacterium]